LQNDVAVWLKTRLGALFPKCNCEVRGTSKVKLSGLLYEMGLQDSFPASEALDFRVDLTGILHQNEKVALVFVNCQTGPISIKDIGPMLEYSVAARPLLAAIISPAGMSSSLHLLLSAYNRVDLLDYGDGNRIKIGTWDVGRKQVDPASVIPPGELG
jgi:hypothetical protein